MIRDPKIIEKLYDQFSEIDGQCVGNTDVAFCEIRKNAGTTWTPKDLIDRTPDREGIKGYWRVINCEVFTLWKLTPYEPARQ